MSRNRKKNIKKKKNTTKKTKNIKLIKQNSYIPTKHEILKDEINHNNKLKLKSYIFFLVLIFFLVISCTFVYLYYKESDIVIKDVYLENDNIIIQLNKNAKCSLDDEINNKTNWVESTNNKCFFSFKDKISNIYTKDNNKKITKHEINKDFYILDEINVQKDKFYIAVNGEEKINYSINSRGKINQKIEFTSENEKIATVSDEGIIKGISNGKTIIHLKLLDKEKIVEVISSNLIVPKTTEFNYNKKYLTCNQYSKEENDLLDEILKDRVNTVGYKTKAALVEVARFITLEFPYRISYFSENGRINSYGKGIDGEGRYYHEGLYLHSSRFSNISSSLYGPGTWGCRFYSVPAQLIQNNGLDCSGFISWIFVNAGYEVGDLGAGISSGPDFTDLGNRIRLTTAFDENNIKVGDLLSQEPGGEHIALIAGMKDNYIYVAESLWYGTGYLGAIMRKYDKQELLNNFYWLVDMNDFYENDGIFTEYWIN